jgi:hypothetical protein
MLHEPVFAIFMATVAVSISLLVWNLISAGPGQGVTGRVEGDGVKKAA